MPSNNYALLLGSALIGASLCAAAPSPKANWHPCYRETGLPFECSTVQVPLNHQASNGAAISIAMVRLPATDPARRIGSLFLNPGGPGMSGVDFALSAAPFLYTPEVRARFDMVGFDPRGISRSTALKCFGNAAQDLATLPPVPFPMNATEYALWEGRERDLVSACDQRAGRILDFMTTADVARDLDLLRQAVGDDKLNFVGLSYGSYIGVTYASLFPGRVRAVVVDGVLDPVAWSTGSGDGSTVPFTTRLRSDQGAQKTLDEFFRLCDDPSSFCAFKSAQPSSARYADLAERLKTTPLILPTPNGPVRFGYAELVGTTLTAMYNSLSWPYLAQTLTLIDTVSSPAAISASFSVLADSVGFTTKRGAPNYPNVEGYPGVACSDSDNPRNYSIWIDTAPQAEQQYGYFGRIWTWSSSVCATWPGPSHSRYAGPFTAATANPVLVVGNFFDPATRYEGAQKVAALLPNSTLLSVHAWGHTSVGLSACADATVSQYLVTGAPPPSGSVCNQEIIPLSYPAPPPATAASTETQRGRAHKKVVDATLPEAVRAAFPVR